MKGTHRWAAFISGEGTNLQVLLDHPEYADLRVVVSNRADALGLKRAEKSRIATKVFSCSARLNHQEQMQSWLQLSDDLKQEYQVQSIFLLGFMKIIPSEFIAKWPERILNLHPSLLPEFPGIQALEKSYAANGAMGVTIHQVIAELDAGPILKQHQVFAKGEAANHSLVEVRKKIQAAEHELVEEVFRIWQ